MGGINREREPGFHPAPQRQRLSRRSPPRCHKFLPRCLCTVVLISNLSLDVKLCILTTRFTVGLTAWSRGHAVFFQSGRIADLLTELGRRLVLNIYSRSSFSRSIPVFFKRTPFCKGRGSQNLASLKNCLRTGAHTLALWRLFSDRR